MADESSRPQTVVIDVDRQPEDAEQKIHVHGVCGGHLTPEAHTHIATATAVVAGRRLARLLPGDAPTLIPVTPVADMLDQVAARLRHGPVVVLASGDPLFYGIGRRLLARFKREQLVFYPALSAMQLACARFRIPWDDLALLSLHGRELEDAAARILARQRTMVFTDQHNSPDRIAAAIMDLLAESGDQARLATIRVQVAENLALPDEHLSSGSLADIRARDFAPLNMMLVEQPNWQEHDLPALGLTESEIIHSRGLITKDEVRAVILHRLRLPGQGVFWDVGGGSGSIALEAAGLAPGLRIFTIERSAEGWENIRANIKKFGRHQVRLVRGEAPAALADLPDPDRVFIGGSGGRLAGIIHACAGRLRPGGRMVVSAVLERTAAQAPACMADCGLRVSTGRIEVERIDNTGSGRRLNPITIIVGTT
jgi:precorrin-6Y C5,15-methyltransferase (decarboxylating)